MDNGMKAYIIEKEGVSDTEYEIININFENGEQVKAGDILLEYETSKTLIEVEAEMGGFFYSRYSEGMYIEVGEQVALVSTESQDVSKLFEQKKEISDTIDNDLGQVIDRTSSEVSNKNILFTAQAAELLNSLQNIEHEFPENTYITKKDLISRISSMHFHLPVSSIKSKAKLVLIGAGGMIETVIQAAKEEGKYDIVGILDPKADIGKEYLGIPVIGREEDVPKILASGVSKAIITFAAAGKRKVRHENFERFLAYGFEMVNIIHPRSIVDATANLGRGNLILEGAKVGTECSLGDNNYINVGSVLCHHSIVKDNVHLAPNSIIAGNVIIDSHCLIGMGATIVSGCYIGKNVVINNGVSIVTNIENNKTVKGYISS